MAGDQKEGERSKCNEVASMVAAAQFRKGRRSQKGVTKFAQPVQDTARHNIGESP
jgi:hypothetical protein